MFIEAKDDGGGGDNWTTAAISRAKLQSNHHHQQTDIQFFYMPDALPVTQPTVSKHWRENITFHELAYPKLTWGLSTLSLTNNSSWLPLERFAMPLKTHQPLTPVPQQQKMQLYKTKGKKHLRNIFPGRSWKQWRNFESRVTKTCMENGKILKTQLATTTVPTIQTHENSSMKRYDSGDPFWECIDDTRCSGEPSAALVLCTSYK